MKAKFDGMNAKRQTMKAKRDGLVLCKRLLRPFCPRGDVKNQHLRVIASLSCNKQGEARQSDCAEDIRKHDYKE